ncbi:MAG: hypothetical protein FJ087_10775 [Deltaproteobacteria bacterium]|nr:hypothetical protein [Deltaproteobacteria bacterium]
MGGRGARTRLVDLSRRYSVLCSVATLLAIEDAEPASSDAAARSRGRPARRRIPIALAHGWHGWDAGGQLAYASTSAPPPSARVHRSTRAALRLASVALPASLDAPAEEVPEALPDDPLVRLCSLQRADGSWPLSRELLDLAGDAAPDRASLPRGAGLTGIRDIEEAAGGARRSGTRTGRDRLIELSRRHSVLCSATTYLAVEETAEAGPATRGRPARRRIPIALAHGWHGWDTAWVDTAWVDTASRGFSLRRRTASLRLASVPLASSLSYCCTAPDAPDAAPVRESGGPAREDPLVRLCSLRRADGSWDLTPEVTELVAGEEADFQVLRADPPLRPDVADRVLATGMAIRVLAHRFADRADAWHMIADKAVAWLAGVGMLDAVGGDPRAARAAGA